MSDQYLNFLAKLKPTPSETPAPWKDVIKISPCKYPVHLPNTYIATIYHDWSFGEFALGGVLYALSLEATKKHVRIEQPKLNLPDAVSSYINFFKPASPGQVVIKIDTLNLGGQYANFRATIYQYNPKSKSSYQCSECLVTLGNLDKEDSRPKQLAIPRPDHPLYQESAKTFPSSRDGWAEVPIQKRVPGFYSNKPGVRMLYPPDTVFDNKDGSQPHPKFGPLVREHWWRGEDPWTAGHLPLFVDSQPPMHSNFKQGFTYWGPTLSMSMDLYKRPPVTRQEKDKEGGSEWLWTRVEVVGHKGGRYLGDFVIKDEEGDMVAVGRILNLAVPYQAFSKGQDQKKQQKTESKKGTSKI